MKSQFSQMIRFKFHHPLKIIGFSCLMEQSHCRIFAWLFWIKCPFCSKKPLWWTNDYPLNAMGQIVHIAMIPIFRHCHAVVSTNPMLWSILNLAQLVLRMGLNTACGGILYEQKIYPQKAVWCWAKWIFQVYYPACFWLDNMRSH